MPDTKKLVIISLSMLVGGAVAAWGLAYLNLGYLRFFAPRQAAIERQIFDNSPSAVNGNLQDILRWKLEYLRTKDTLQRSALKVLILDAKSRIPPDRIPTEIQTFITENFE